MCRLIDADEIIKQLDSDTWQGEMMIAIVNGLPTAYDVNKVVKQLKDLEKDECVLYYVDVIDIIKAGGRDD